MLEMGNTVHKYRTFISLAHRREIINERSLRCVIQVVQYLKLNVHNRQVFRDIGHRRRVCQIATYLTTGNSDINNILAQTSPTEAATGLRYYLDRLPKPVLFPYIQSLALDADTQVRPETVATDILGLISQDIKGFHLILIAVLLDLLNFVHKHVASDEIAGCNVPVSMMPIFFQLKPQHMTKMRYLSTIFMEIITLSPAFLPLSDRRICHLTDFTVPRRSRANRQYNNTRTNIPANEENIYNISEVSEILRDAVLRHTYIRNGNDGDAHFPEIVSRTRNRPAPLMMNSVFGYYGRRF